MLECATCLLSDSLSKEATALSGMALLAPTRVSLAIGLTATRLPLLPSLSMLKVCLRILPKAMLENRFTALFGARATGACLKSVALGLSMVVIGLSGCSAADVSSPDAPAAEMPVRLPTMRLSSRPATAIDSLSESQVDKTIAVSGEVVQKAALLEGWMYQVRDETGSLWVLTNRAAPEVGEMATVEGAIRYEPIMVGEIDAGEVYLEEKGYQREGQ